jgi:hypothetical protein
MLRLFIFLLLPLAVAADPIAQILQYAADTGDVAGAERLCAFYGENVPGDVQLFKALGERLADGTWQSLDSSARKETEIFGFTAPPKNTVSLVETFARAVVEGISPQNLKVRADLATQYAGLLRDSQLFPWMVKELTIIRENENKRVSLLKRGQMIIDDAQKRLGKLNTGTVTENRYDKLQQMRKETSAGKARLAETRSKLEQERNRGLEMVNQSYDYEDAAKALQAFVKEVGAKVREARK